MGRLIDADKCPCIFCEDTRNAHCTYEHRSCEKFCDWLNNAAYDVEKVVEETGNVLNDLNVVEVLSHVEPYTTIQRPLENFLDSFKAEIRRIVRRGGVK